MNINKISANGQIAWGSTRENVANKTNTSFKALNFAHGQDAYVGKVRNVGLVPKISMKSLSGFMATGIAGFLSILPNVNQNKTSHVAEYASVAAKTAKEAQNTAYAIDINRAEMAENERLKGTRAFNKERFEAKMAAHPVIKELRELHQNIVEDNNEVSELFARDAAVKLENDLDKVFSQSKTTKFLESFGFKSLEDIVGDLHSKIDLDAYCGTIDVSKRQAEKLIGSSFNVPVAKTAGQSGIGILMHIGGKEEDNSLKLMVFGPAASADFEMLTNLNKSLARDCGSALEKLLNKHFPGIETRNFNKFSSRSLNENIVENYLINKFVSGGVKILKDKNSLGVAVLDRTSIASVR